MDWGNCPVSSVEKTNYFLSVIDDYNRYGEVFTTKQKKINILKYLAFIAVLKVFTKV